MSIIVFFLLLLFLFFLSTRLKILLHQFFCFLTKSRSWSISLFSLLFFPGTVVHELSHFLIASILLVPVSNIELVPKISHQGKVRLGTVQIAKVDFLRRTIIGLAPLFAGLAILWFIFSFFIFNNLAMKQFSNFLLQGPASWTTTISNLQITNYKLLITVFLIFSISNMMFSSKKDLGALIAFIPFVLIVLTVLYLLGFDFTGVKIAGEIMEILLNILSQLNLILLFSIIINLIVFIFLYLFSKFLRFKTI